jgi:hypothetical protein
MTAAFLGEDLFFAPVQTDLVDMLIGEYHACRQKIEDIDSALWQHGLGSVVEYFINGNSEGRGYKYTPSARDLFKSEGAMKALNADFWDRALKLTDVLDCMPQKRRDEWFEQIREMKTPDFEDATVRATLQDLLTSRAKFFAERVDGIFRALSHEHVTNRPEGFGKRMILNYVLSEYASTGTSQQGYINDLRCIVAKFMGRTEPHWSATGQAVAAARRNWGEWMTLDGGALRLRVYKKGTGHLEVHPDMAWRLNGVLASMHPSAIPEQHRRPPPRKAREVSLMERPLPFAVLDLLAGMKEGTRVVKSSEWRREYDHIPVRNSLKFQYGSDDKHVREQARNVLLSIGAVYDGELDAFRFDYPPQDVVDQIVCSGVVPDDKSHQFYPTSERLAALSVELAEIQPDHVCLEPSAGNGDLLQLLPSGSDAVEVSPLRCEILRSRFKEVAVHETDFLQYSPKLQYDRIVMNPPFDQGRWRTHLDHAASLLGSDGRIVAILPSGAQCARDLLPGYSLTWRGPFENEFPGSSVAVVVLTAEPAVEVKS